MSRLTTIHAIDLVAAIGFIVALMGLSNPKGARIGNLIGATGMALALGITFATPGLSRFALIVVAMAVGVVIGVPAARLVKMTAMPQMVAAFNGVGGGAAALVALIEFLKRPPSSLAIYEIVEVLLGVIIGCVSFAGSVVAFAKLQELMTGRPVTYPGQQVFNAMIAVGIVGLGVALCVSPHTGLLVIVAALALAFGVVFVLPIGGADVPVLISLLNSFTGLAVAASGFVIDSVVLVVAGTLVGASGTLLTRMMSKAMGRSLPNILFSAFGSVITASGATEDATGRTVRSGSVEDLAVLLAYSHKVIIVPGYGLAVAQAQHIANELAHELESRGVEVFYAIHPVAGRMPGHMNVLLAEANVPYDELKEMDEANPEFATADVALVVGANDVVNPAAKNSPGSPIYGMPILNVDEAKNIVFMKRSMRPGFAGIDNDLLYNPKTTLLFGDAKDSLTKLVAAVKAAQTMSGRVPYLNSRLQGYTSTIFAEMSALAAATGSINLGQGFPDTDGPDLIKKAAIAAITAGHNQYPPGIGVAELREAIASHQKTYYGLTFDPEREILVTAGATEAIAATLLALCEVGDEVVMFEPYYDSYAACTAMAGATRRVVPLRPPDWHFDPQELEAAVNERTRLIMVNTPHNPTGKVFSRDELEQIARCCEKHDLLALTDEVYEHLVFDSEHIPLASLDNMAERTITVSSAAKTFSVTGWKIGWVCAPAPLVTAIRSAKQFLTYASGTPLQYAVAEALVGANDYVAQLASDLVKKRDLLAAGLAGVGLRVFDSAGTFFLTTDIAPLGEKDGWEFCLSLPKRCGVVAIPSAVFYDDKLAAKTLVRWTFCKRTELLEEAIERLSKL